MAGQCPALSFLRLRQPGTMDAADLLFCEHGMAARCLDLQ
jgi:hypothetical protein